MRNSLERETADSLVEGELPDRTCVLLPISLQYEESTYIESEVIKIVEALIRFDVIG